MLNVVSAEAGKATDLSPEPFRFWAVATSDRTTIDRYSPSHKGQEMHTGFEHLDIGPNFDR